MIKCGECGNEVSDKAASCPKCGAPINPPVPVRTPSVPTGPAPKKSKNIGCGTTLVILIAVAWLISRLLTPEPSTTVSLSPPATHQPPVVAATLLEREQAAVKEGNWGAALTSAEQLKIQFPSAPESVDVDKRIAEHTKRRDAATAKANAEREAARRNALSGFTKHRDEMQSVTFWYAPGGDVRHVGNRFGLYLVQPDSGAPYLRFRWMYHGDDWLFIDRLMVKIDALPPVDAKFGHFSVERDNGGGNVWEWKDEAIEHEAHLQLFRRIADAKKVVLRFEGRQYYKDRTLTAGERQAIKRVLSAWDALKPGAA